MLLPERSNFSSDLLSQRAPAILPLAAPSSPAELITRCLTVLLAASPSTFRGRGEGGGGRHGARGFEQEESGTRHGRESRTHSTQRQDKQQAWRAGEPAP